MLFGRAGSPHRRKNQLRIQIDLIPPPRPDGRANVAPLYLHLHLPGAGLPRLGLDPLRHPLAGKRHRLFQVDEIAHPVRQVRPQPSVPPDDIAARLLLPMILEATRLLEDGTVRDPRAIDLGAIFGLGFPAARGGLLYWADTVGIERILAMLRALTPLGPHVAPTGMLLDMARRGGRFHGGDSGDSHRG